MKAALYTRVSKRESDQTTENQIAQLRQFCQARGWDIVSHYDEQESGARHERKMFRRMLADASRNRFEVLVFWSLDRFGREGVFQTLSDLRELDAANIRFLSFTEQYLDTVGVFRDAVIAILAAVAKMERVRISERVKAGLERIKREGRRLGRKPAEIDEETLRKALAGGMTYREMSRLFGVGRTTLYERIKHIENQTREEKESAQ